MPRFLVFAGRFCGADQRAAEPRAASEAAPSLRDVVLLALLVLCAVAIFALDRSTPPDVPVAALYTVPLFLAGAWLPRRLVPVAALATVVLYLVDGGLRGAAWGPWALGAGLLALAGWWAVRTGADHARLRALTAALAEQTCQMEAARQQRREMIAVLAHELRGALSPVKGYTQWLLKAEQRRDPRTALLAIAQASDRMARLIQDLADDASLELGELSLAPAVCDLTGVVEESVELLRAVSGREIRLAMPEGRVVGEWDEVRVHQVLGNLLSNSLKYAPAGEPITVNVGANAGTVTVSVSNRSPEVDPEGLAHLFLPYARLPAHARLRGSGLGLYVSKAIMERHGGSLEARLQDGHLTFTLTLPRAGAAPACAGAPRGALPGR